MKSDHIPSSGGKHKESKPASPNAVAGQNKNANLYDKAQLPPGATGNMAQDGYGKKSM